jgi:DNA processing protein
MHELELSSLHALRSLPAVGDKTIRLLVTHFGSGEAAWEYSGSFAITGISKKAEESLTKKQTLLNRASLWAELEKEAITILHAEDPLYPKLLKEIPDHPLLLYVRGAFDWVTFENKPTIAIVGSRKFTAYGEQVALRLSYDLAQAGFVVISGLAFGIDKKAHLGTLEATGETLAVLGGSITDADIAPRSNLSLAQKILETGALVSEYPPHTPIFAGNFPMRNRIIAGLARGVLVIEATEKSGSLITATLALDYNREVFAIPGSIFSPASTGTNTLLKRGAKLITHVNDILEEFNLMHHDQASSDQKPDRKIDLPPQEEKVYKLLTHEPEHINSLARHTGLGVNEIQSILTLLEIKGLVKNIGAMQYIRNPGH